MANIENIKSATNDFRTQKDDLFIGIGRELIKKGIDISKVVIADMFTEDFAQYYVVIVTSSKNVFEFYYDYLHKEPSDGEIIEWHDFTKTPEKAYMHESVMTVLNYIEELG